jgi:hypothetical protein
MLYQFIPAVLWKFIFKKKTREGQREEWKEGRSKGKGRKNRNDHFWNSNQSESLT